MRLRALALSGLLIPLFGCGMQGVSADSSAAAPAITSVTPSASGIPNTVAVFGKFAFVSVQGTGQIFTYNTATGTPVLAAAPYSMPCAYPSGMVFPASTVGDVMAVVCFDTDSLLTLSIHADGSLSALGSVSGLPMPFPGIVLDGTDAFVPLYGKTLLSNGGVARVSLASAAHPVVTGTATLISPAPGVFANPGYLAVADGNLYLTAGSESNPQLTSSTIQVVNEATMQLVGTPFVVAHSPQQIAVIRGVAFVTYYGAAQLQAISLADPANLVSLAVLPLPSCHAVPITVRSIFAYVGCYAEGGVQRINISDPTNMQLASIIADISHPQRLEFSGHYLLATDSVSGGLLYQIDTGPY